jgi:signal transduction histidine kinase
MKNQNSAGAAGELARLAELARKSAHELNNLLTIVRMNAELLASDLAKRGWTGQETQEIIAAAERAETLTRALLESARRAPPR